MGEDRNEGQILIDSVAKISDMGACFLGKRPREIKFGLGCREFTFSTQCRNCILFSNK